MPAHLHKRHDYPGKLIIVEGIDGSGKSTQLDLLHTWLNAEGYSVFFTEWNSSALIKDTTKLGKKKKILTPTTFSLLHCIDFADRFYNAIIPPLKAGMIVLCDRYIYTAFARDAARGCDKDWLRSLYSYAVRPDMAMLFRVDLATSLKRIKAGRAEIKYHEAGMDLNLSPDIEESFRLFQGRVVVNYDAMIEEFGLSAIDGAQDIDSQQKEFRKAIKKILKGYKQKPLLTQNLPPLPEEVVYAGQ
ncbi:thymidylate kinase [Candidatus Sumerlaeota bacterium]|nr:thymidylate kinase [Candidatus Sumerlaeota bacterium]